MIALIIGLSVGLSKCGSGDGSTIASESSSGSKVSSDDGSSSSKGDDGSSDSKGGDKNNKITDESFASALIFNGDKFTITLTETNEVTTMVKNGNAVRWTNTAGTGSDEYYSKVSEGGSTTYYIYTKDSSGTWTKDEDDSASSYYEYYATRDVDEDLFDGKLATSKRTFNEGKGGYTLSYTDDDNVKVDAELYFNNSRLTKAVKTEGSETKTYAFSDTAVDISLPANPHTHSYSTKGKLDLNSVNGDYVVSCACGKIKSRARLEADTYDSVLYGYYPQTLISDEATITSLEALTAESNGWYKLGDTYYAKVAAGDTDRKFKDGTTITPGKEYWYSCDPIEWKVLASETGKHTLVSSLLLEAHQYDESLNNYEDSEIRKWINGTFYNTAFSLGDSRIEVTNVDNSNASVYEPSSYVCDNTNDKVYLLSYQDCENTDYFADADARKCQVTDYARASGANFNDDNYGEYWARSPWATGKNYATYVQADGEENWHYVNDSGNCVRPVITVKVPAASDHQHKEPSSGSLDLNGDKVMFRGECSSCGNTFTRECASTDNITSVLYGYYPQTHVNDITITAKLEKLTAEENGWYLLDGTYYAKATQNVEHYDTTFDDGTKIMYGTYFWFKVEPIEWNILSISNGQYSLVSKLILDTQAYDANTSNNYQDSDIRKWLTGEFQEKAFAKDSAYLATVNVDNSASTTDSSSNSYACTNTDDKVYLLSYQDYQNTAYFADAKARQCKTSEWTRNNFGQVNMEDNYAGTYWTRSPHSGSENCVWFVDGDDGGNMDYEDSAKTYFSVRPAITVKP